MTDGDDLGWSRRHFLRRSLLGGAGALGLGRLQRALAGAVPAATLAARPGGYGPLKPARDQTTGLRLLELPEGFRYLSMGWTGDPMVGGHPTPPAHDGTAAFAGAAGRVVLVRNHEVENVQGPLDPGAPQYDPRAGGGCTALVFDPQREALIETRAALAGTFRNCAGGPTPWGSWLSCEETLIGPGDRRALKRPHGYVFEVPLDRPAEALPILGMGRLFHEACAVDPGTGVVYHTEDRETAGFYRYLPARRGDLQGGGKLQMLAVEEAPHLATATGQIMGRRMKATWVDIATPDRAHSPDAPGDCLGVYRQGKDQGAATFKRLEGCWWGHDRVFFCSTSGGDKGGGQVWSYQPADEALELVYEAPNRSVLTGPDNITVSPRGGLLLCEDGGGRPMQLNLLTAAGTIVPFAKNAVRLSGQRGFHGDFRFKEFTGACFSPDGAWLFANAQVPGITFAITGPWERGEL